MYVYICIYVYIYIYMYIYTYICIGIFICICKIIYNIDVFSKVSKINVRSMVPNDQTKLNLQWWFRRCKPGKIGLSIFRS